MHRIAAADAKAEGEMVIPGTDPGHYLAPLLDVPRAKAS